MRESGWNWWAFLFGPFWYLWHGMIGKAVVLFLIAAVAFPFSTIAVGVFAGFSGNQSLAQRYRRQAGA